ncbi:MAG: ROK family transcriptional regulator, partial [Calditrichota bacterium]
MTMKTDPDKNEKLIPGNHANVRLVNRCVILNLIRAEQPISRVAMGRMISLTKSTISNIVADLIEEGLVQEISVEKSTGGRKPTLLKLNSSGMICGAIAMLREKTLIGVVNLDGHILDHLTLPMAEGDPKRFIEFCAKHLAVMLQKLSGYTTLGIGVSVSGMVSQQDGRIISMPDPEWRNVSIRLILERMFNLPVMLDNDANVEALANLFYGTRSGIQDFVQVALRDGIGVGIVMNGRLLKGSGNSSIEFGHTIICEGGELCTCGKRGCWEAYASDLATIRKYNKLLDGNGNHESPPSRPVVASLEAKPIENGIRLNWEVNHAAIKYAIYRSKKENVSTSTTNLLTYVESPPFIDFAVEEDSIYNYNVRALNLFDEGEVAEREVSCRAPKITYTFNEEFHRETLQNYETFGNKKPRVKNNLLKVGARPPLQEDTVVYRRESYSDYVITGRVKPGEIGSWDSAGVVVKVQSGEEWYYAMIAYGDYLLEK